MSGWRLATAHCGLHACSTHQGCHTPTDQDTQLVCAAGSVQLLKGADPEKDQSYFLASVQQASLQRADFPLGALSKQHVRALAAQAGIPSAARRSSAGICFIGEADSVAAGPC